ncbi:cation:proton antiporter [Laceyella sacchari]|uniref:Cation:proton antiporter n=1 Tax=Laceyella sacchari TaxID=37482 RepID=A0ABY5U034_LACSH|nr:cation:proton antiporter [Laceyella sacchari]UWE02395.1 cation:proton antiporter [Laceyella sacchari]
MGNNMHLFLDFIPALILVLVASYICGNLARYIGQPKVVGEMIAGILIGPSFLGIFAPQTMSTLFTADVKSILYILSNLGLGMYMFLVGAEVDENKLTKSLLRKCTILSTSGILVPLLLGVAIGFFYYSELSLPNVHPFLFALFIGSALSLTAFPMLARIIQERNLTTTHFGTLALLAASIDDALAWCLVALITALAQAQGVFAGVSAIVFGAIFACFMLLLVKKWMVRLGDKVEKAGSLSINHFSLILLLLLLAIWFTDYIGIYSVFGGFIVGLAMPRHKVFARELQSKFQPVVISLLLPIFFAYSGLNTDLTTIFSNMSLLIPAIVVLIASIAGKYGGCALAMKSIGYSWREASAIGMLMNARGLMVLILVNIGISYHIITTELFAILVLMTLVTTIGATPVFNLLYPTHPKEKRGVIDLKPLPKQS